MDFQVRSQEGQGEHRQEYCYQAPGCACDILAAMWQDAEAPVDEFDVYPVDEQGSLAEQDERAESPLA